jgi:hypothetical protein
VGKGSGDNGSASLGMGIPPGLPQTPELVGRAGFLWGFRPDCCSDQRKAPPKRGKVEIGVT